MQHLDRLRKVLDMRTRSLWTVHLITLFSIVIWAMIDLRFESLIRSLRMPPVSAGAWFYDAAEGVGQVRVILILCILSIAATTLCMLIGNRFRSARNPQSRSIRSLLAIALVVAIWCSIAANYSALAWQGQRIRVGFQINQLEVFTEALRDDWPARDGEIPAVGPFMAYPFGRPTVLVLLVSPTLANDQLSISAIERSTLGAIKLQLSGTEHDDWAEWHPAGSHPASFVGGLSDPHDLESFTNLGKGWSLVRYRS